MPWRSLPPTWGRIGEGVDERSGGGSMNAVTAGGAPAGLVFRDMTPEDVPAVLRLCRLAGWNQRTEDWQPLLANGGFARMERPADAEPVRAEQGPTVPRPLTAPDLVGLAARDGAVFGADRSAVLAWARAQAPEYAWSTGAREEPAGYVLGRHGHRTEHLGPLVADDEETAARLLTAILAAVPGRAFTIDIPDRPAWRERIRILGFREQRPFRRMILGDAPSPGDPRQRFAILGPEFG